MCLPDTSYLRETRSAFRMIATPEYHIAGIPITSALQAPCLMAPPAMSMLQGEMGSAVTDLTHPDGGPATSSSGPAFQ